MTKIIPVILCGGSGTRLWPLSREEMPKQFLHMMGDVSLLQETALRAMRVAKAEAHEVVTVTLDQMRKKVIGQMVEIDADLTRHIIGEPVARNTAAAIAYAASYVRSVFGDQAVMWVMPSDHYIGDLDALSDALNKATHAAAAGFFATFGIKPTRPDTGYGYIQVGREKVEYDGVFHAQKFVEKPDVLTAQSYLDQGEFVWNSGMFLLPVQDVIKAFQTYAPEVIAGVTKATGGNPKARLSLEAYTAIPSLPFDKAIMEKSDRVVVVPCDPQWSDIGSFESLWGTLPKNDDGNVFDGRIAAVDTKNCFVSSDNRLVACIGLENIVVADTGDAVLIADMNKPDAMRTLVSTLKNMKAEELIYPSAERRPWGMFKVLSRGDKNKVKEITVAPGQQLSLQMHHHRCEFWVIVEGEAEVTINGVVKTYKAQEMAVIPFKAQHRLANKSQKPLRIIEVQCGDYLGEDDIVRFDDIYGRMAAE